MSPTSRPDVHRPPSALFRALEFRAPLEFGAFLASAPALQLAARGDGHPVLVLPGFTATDRSTGPLRGYLRSLGYSVHGWDLGRNVGPTDRILRLLPARLEELAARYGRAVSLVGWSLGGIFARALAREHRGAVRQVVTLGSPFNLRDRSSTNAARLFEALRPAHSIASVRRVPFEFEAEPVPRPATSIYSRSDGVVPWQTCLQATDGQHENVEVWSSHVGLGHNPASLIVIADRLAQAPGCWRPFRPSRAVARLFPRPPGPATP